MSRLLAGLTLGGLLVLTPVGPADLVQPAAQAQPAVAATALELPAQAPPGPDLTGADQSQGKQRIAIGIGGVVLIALVLLSRKSRKKPMFGFKWKS